MFIKQFREQQVRVQDPLRPGRRVFETRLNPTGCHAVSVGGEVFRGDEDHWIEVSEEAGTHLRSFRGGRGEHFYTPEEVDEEVAAGRIKEDPADALPTPPPAKAAGTTKKAAAAAKG